MLEVLSNLSISTIIITVIAIAPLLTGLRIFIQSWFDIFIDKKILIIYLIFYIVLLSILFMLFSFNFFGGGLIASFSIMFLIIIIIIAEYFLIYKKYFDFEPSEKYVLCISASYIFVCMLLLLILNLLTIFFTLLFG